MEAAERIFGGAFDDVHDESSETSVPSASPSGMRERWPVTARLVVCVLPRALWFEIFTPFQTPEEEDVASEEAAGSGEDDNEGEQSRCFRPPPPL